jgi:hypothetical protein
MAQKVDRFSVCIAYCKGWMYSEVDRVAKNIFCCIAFRFLSQQCWNYNNFCFRCRCVFIVYVRMLSVAETRLQGVKWIVCWTHRGCKQTWHYLKALPAFACRGWGETWKIIIWNVPNANLCPEGTGFDCRSEDPTTVDVCSQYLRQNVEIVLWKMSKCLPERWVDRPPVWLLSV